MKTLTLVSILLLVFTGCTQEIRPIGKEECKKLGYKHAMEKRLNYRTGKYEMRFICLDKIK